MATAKSTKAPAFQFYPKDFLSSTKVQRMSLTEVGAYTLLLSHCWLDGGLPTDVGELARIVKVKPAQFAKWWAGALGECFHEKSGRFHNARLDDERKKQDAFRRRQSDRADKGWQKRRNAAPGNAAALPDARRTDALLSPISDLQSPSTPSEERRGRAPLHGREHRQHAQCGRVCLHGSLFGEFVRRRGHVDADREVRDWALAVEREWSEGLRAAEEPGDSFDFWRARYAEQWPSVSVKKSAQDAAWDAVAGAK